MIFLPDTSLTFVVNYFIAYLLMGTVIFNINISKFVQPSKNAKFTPRKIDLLYFFIREQNNLKRKYRGICRKYREEESFFDHGKFIHIVTFLSRDYKRKVL